MNKFAEQVGRSYHLFDYVGAPDAERVIVMMGSGAEVAHEAIDALNAQGEKAGIAQSALVPAIPVKSFLEALPASVRTDCRPRPYQGIGSDWRAALSRRCERAARRNQARV